MKKLLTVAVLAFSMNVMSQEVYIPNAFTPNGDDHNDVWKPVFDDTLSISNYLLEVYTRNGQLVFETRDSLQYWDGTYWGSDVDGSTYVYRLVMKTDTEDIRREGFLEVLR